MLPCCWVLSESFIIALNLIRKIFTRRFCILMATRIAARLSEPRGLGIFILLFHRSVSLVVLLRIPRRISYSVFSLPSSIVHQQHTTLVIRGRTTMSRLENELSNIISPSVALLAQGSLHSFTGSSHSSPLSLMTHPPAIDQRSSSVGGNNVIVFYCCPVACDPFEMK